MKKIIFLATLIFALAVGICCHAAPLENISVVIDYDLIEFDVPPKEINGRTLVPLRKIFEVLGAVVEYNPSTLEVTATKGNKVIKLTIDDNKMDVNGKISTLDVPATVDKGRTLVPVRAISEALECDVAWDAEISRVIITSKERKDAYKLDPTGKLIASAEPSINKAEVSLKKDTLSIVEGSPVVKGGKTSSVYEKNEKEYTWEHKTMDVFHFNATVKHPKLARDEKIPIEIRISTDTNKKDYVRLTRDISLSKGVTESKVSFAIDFYSEDFYAKFLKYAEDPVRLCYTIYYDSKELGAIYQRLDYGYQRERNYFDVVFGKSPTISLLNSTGVEIQTSPEFKKATNIADFKVAFYLDCKMVPQYYTYPVKFTIYKYGKSKAQKENVSEKLVDFVNYKEKATASGEHLIELHYGEKFATSLMGNYTLSVSIFGEEIASTDFTFTK